MRSLCAYIAVALQFVATFSAGIQAPRANQTTALIIANAGAVISTNTTPRQLHLPGPAADTTIGDLSLPVRPRAYAISFLQFEPRLEARPTRVTSDRAPPAHTLFVHN